MYKKIALASSCLVLLALSGCGNEESATFTLPIKELTISPYNQDLPSGNATHSEQTALGTQMHLRFQAIATYLDGTTRDVTDSVSWTSSQPELASFTSQAGELTTFNQSGNIDIQATMHSGAAIDDTQDKKSNRWSAQISDNVLQETRLYTRDKSMDVSHKTIPALTDMDITLKAVNIYSDGTYQDVSDFVQ